MAIIPLETGSPEWLAFKRDKIGGSAVANIVCGDMPEAHTWGTPLTEWMRLTGRSKDEREVTAEMQWGLDTEDLNARILAREAGLQITKSNAVVTHEQHPWIAGTPDAMCSGADGSKWCGAGVVEFKAPSRYTESEWFAEQAPLSYQIQLETYLMLCGPALGAEWGIICALIPPGVRWQLFQRNAAHEQWIMERLIDFRERYWLRDIPPPASPSKMDLAALRELYKQDNGVIVELNAEMRDASMQLVEVQGKISILEDERDVLKIKIMEAIGQARYAKVTDGFHWKYATQANGVRPLKKVKEPR